VDPHSRKPCRIAEEEIQAGRVKWEIPAGAAAGSMEASGEMQDGPVGGDADD
jgi:hypothetical protein